VSDSAFVFEYETQQRHDTCKRGRLLFVCKIYRTLKYFKTC
jgi:hypothetical protein